MSEPSPTSTQTDETLISTSGIGVQPQYHRITERFLRLALNAEASQHAGVAHEMSARSYSKDIMAGSAPASKDYEDSGHHQKSKHHVVGVAQVEHSSGTNKSAAVTSCSDHNEV
ncbi:hypothetical protein LTS10_007960 [Elasticomyces elasticus]|nr:hypothetical protein LTS10_007960 [Elasticomyces elasticus]